MAYNIHTAHIDVCRCVDFMDFISDDVNIFVYLISHFLFVLFAVCKKLAFFSHYGAKIEVRPAWFHCWFHFAGLLPWLSAIQRAKSFAWTPGVPFYSSGRDKGESRVTLDANDRLSNRMNPRFVIIHSFDVVTNPC